MKELCGADVAYRKLISPTTSNLLPADQFGLYAVTARFPQKLSHQVPWQERQVGVYDCRWGTDSVRVLVAGELPREPHNTPLHLFSAQPELVGFGRDSYQRRSGDTSALLRQLFDQLSEEGFAMSYTMEDFRRKYAKEHFAELTREEQRETLQHLAVEHRREILESLTPEERLSGLPVEQRLSGLTEEQIRQYLGQLIDRRSSGTRKTPRKK
jgi:hypothetical protein